MTKNICHIVEFYFIFVIKKKFFSSFTVFLYVVMLYKTVFYVKFNFIPKIDLKTCNFKNLEKTSQEHLVTLFFIKVVKNMAANNNFYSVNLLSYLRRYVA